MSTCRVSVAGEGSSRRVRSSPFAASEWFPLAVRRKALSATPAKFCANQKAFAGGFRQTLALAIVRLYAAERRLGVQGEVQVRLS